MQMKDIAPRIALGLALALGCGPEPDRERQGVSEIELSVGSGEVVGTEVLCHVSLRGCDAASVTIQSHGAVLQTIESPEETFSVALPAWSLPFPQAGMPASLQLVAEASCADGQRIRTSPRLVQVLPAAQFFEGPWPFQDNFWVETHADGIFSFLTCDGKSLVRYSTGKQRTVLGNMPFKCDAATQLLFDAEGGVYALQPGGRFAAFSSDLELKFSVELPSPLNLAQLLVPEQAGDPVIALAWNDLATYRLYAYSAEDGKALWNLGLTSIAYGIPAGELAFQTGSDGVRRVLFANRYSGEASGNATELRVNGYDSATGVQTGVCRLASLPAELARAPWIALTPDAKTAFFAEFAADETAVRACAVDMAAAGPCGCEGGHQKWRSRLLEPEVTHVRRVGNTLVAHGRQIAWLLNATNGAVVNGEAATVSGDLEYTAVLGVEGSIYLLAQPPTIAGIHQIQIFNANGKKQLDYSGVSLTHIVDVDKAGQAWLWDGDLIQLAPGQRYLEAAK